MESLYVGRNQEESRMVVGRHVIWEEEDKDLGYQRKRRW